MGDMRSENSLFGVIGRDGELRLHVPSTQFPIHYLVGSQIPTPLTKMRNELLNQNQTTWANADTRIIPLKFYEPTLNHRISIREMGVGGRGAFNDFMGRLGNMEDSKREKWAREAIVGLKSLIHGQRLAAMRRIGKHFRPLSWSNYENADLRKRAKV